ncbi:sugar transferase [Novosphingobium sp.]|uniref:sugar transferase n=1 Tax=Novosphingobium sp. TaxID=1874826 RepID=UPI002FDAA805
MPQQGTELRSGTFVYAGARGRGSQESARLFNSLKIEVIRGLDIVFALTALLIFAPLMLLLALAVAILDPGPIFFAHKRIGLGGKDFYCLKFRSMAVDAEQRLQALLASDERARAEWAKDQKLRNDPRITQLGQFLRKSSLDELPQLFNVLRGEMSLVGPRPIVRSEVPRYGRYFEHYCAVRPGITGLWQISGRNDVSYRRRVAFDVTFTRALTTGLYLRILVATVPSVLLQRGTY